MPLPQSGSGPFFQRFRPEDPNSVRRTIDNDREALADARSSQDAKKQVEIGVRLGMSLYVLGDERAAVDTLEEALGTARAVGNRDAEIAVLLHLATARQYLYEREFAQRLFTEALSLSERNGISRHLHFLLHHQGRCFAEQGDLASARQCFERALGLRIELGEERWIVSTRRALEALDHLNDSPAHISPI